MDDNIQGQPQNEDPECSQRTDIDIQEIQPEHHAGILALAEQLPQWFDEKAREKYIHIDIRLHRGYIALKDDRLLGFVSFTSKYGVGIISWIGVHPKHHQKGIGRRLLLAAEGALADAGVHRVTVETVGWSEPEYLPYARTRSFYEAMGYRLSKKLESGQEAGYRWQMCEFGKELA